MFCKSCKREILYLVEGACPKCGNGGKKAPRTPPKTESHKQSNREYMRRKNGIKKGRFVVEHEGLYKRRRVKKWDKFSLATVYSSEARAREVVRNLGYGKVVQL